MTEQPNNGPAWARKAQAKTKWGLGVLVIVVVLIGIRALGFLAAVGGHATDAGRAPAGMTYGGFGAPSRDEAATFLRSLDTAVDSDSKNFDREAKEAVAGGILKPEALFRPGGISAAENALKHERDIVAKYQALAAQRKADGRTKLGALYTDPDQKQRALTAFDNENAQSAATMDEYWRLQYDIIDREEALVTFLANARGAWRPVGGKVMFLNTGMARAYQKDVDDLKATSAQIKEIVAQINAKNEQARAERRASLGE